MLSDGMGHGVKANILSTLTASMLVNLRGSYASIMDIARVILKTLPVCSERKISYSTFTIIDVDHRTGLVSIAEHDNPQAVIIRQGKILNTAWDCDVITENSEVKSQNILTTSFTLETADRIVVMSDGVTQSGLGRDGYPFGWGYRNVTDFLLQAVAGQPNISSKVLAGRVLCQSIHNDDDDPKDDITCAVMNFQPPRKLLLCSCPPSMEGANMGMAEAITSFRGRKIVCGHPLARIVAEQLGKEIVENNEWLDPEVPPTWNIEGIDLVSEGFITISKVHDILDNYSEQAMGQGAAYDICSMLIDSDEVNIVIGLHRNIDSSPYTPDEFDIRRKILKSIGKILETKFLKEVNISFM